MLIVTVREKIDAGRGPGSRSAYAASRTIIGRRETSPGDGFGKSGQATATGPPREVVSSESQNPPDGTSPAVHRYRSWRGRQRSGHSSRRPVLPVGIAAAPSKLAAHYLEAVCDENGKFTYVVDPNSGKVSSSYNILRHAGSIYSLAMFNQAHPDPKAVEAMVRAAAFMRKNYIGPDEGSHALAVWSEPLPEKSDAELGAAGLGLDCADRPRSGKTECHSARRPAGIGALLSSLCRRAMVVLPGKYSPDSGPDEDFNSLYYPGEAALGLISLYELDHRTEWLVAAGNALSYLAKSRVNVRKLPPDHWALIATSRFLQYCPEGECAVSRAELIEHAARICDRFLRDQVGSAPDARRNGAFGADGRTTPAAIRLEGLLATLEYLPDDDTGRRDRIEGAIDRGIAFLLAAQITAGPYAGGMPGAVSSAPHAAEIRIDYVQHALSAWLRYQKMFPCRQEQGHP